MSSSLNRFICHLARYVLIGVTALLSACSFVEFEPSPYTPRRLESVYSLQEDLTFLSWRVRESADLDLVRFEYWDPRSEEWTSMTLSQAPYPSAPYECGSGDICLQFQIEGRLTWPEPAPVDAPSPVRSLHDDGGIYGPIEFRQRVAEVTIGLEPIAVNNNLRFDPRRYDWFQEAGVPLKRSYQWRLMGSSARLGEDHAPEHTLARCQSSSTLSDWEALSAPLLPEDWTERGVCLKMRPRSSLPGFTPTEVLAPLPPSASLKHRGLKYKPQTLTPPAYLITLTDLRVRSAYRCRLLKDELISSLKEGFKRFPSATRVNLDDYRPVTPVGAEALSGCDQDRDRRYPIVQMLDEIKTAVTPVAPEPISLIIGYFNNSEDPLPPHLDDELNSLFTELEQLTHVKVFGVAVTGDVYPPGPWRHFIPWRATEVSSFEEQLKTLTKQIFPFRTMDFISGETPISLRSPLVDSSPLSFKLCALSPESFMWVDTVASPEPYTDRDGLYEWGSGRDPELYLELPEQDRVQERDYYEQSVTVDYEVCTRFCDYPFRAQSGADYLSWAQVNVCQWVAR